MALCVLEAKVEGPLEAVRVDVSLVEVPVTVLAPDALLDLLVGRVDPHQAEVGCQKRLQSLHVLVPLGGKTRIRSDVDIPSNTSANLQNFAQFDGLPVSHQPLSVGRNDSRIINEYAPWPDVRRVTDQLKRFRLSGIRPLRRIFVEMVVSVA